MIRRCRVRMLATGATLLVGALVIGGCSDSPDRYVRFGPVDFADAVTVSDGGRWQLELFENGTCVRIRIVDRGSACVGTAAEPGDVSLATIGGGDAPRFVLVVTGDADASVRVFTDRNIGTFAPTTAALPSGGTVALVELADGERPWGVQVLTAGRDLIAAMSLRD